MDPRRFLPALAAVACACVVATLVVTLVPWREVSDDARPSLPAAPASSAPSASSGPAAVLAAWDRSRAAAWAQGDMGALAKLYVDGSRTGAADVRLLRHYRARGLTVTGLTTQVLALDVVDRTSARLVLVVTDRVVGGRAVGGSVPVALPADRASSRRVVLAKSGGRWRVVEARDQGTLGNPRPSRRRPWGSPACPQASAAASTLCTSSSSKS